MLEMLLTSAVPALLPAIGDGVRGAFAKLTGSAGAKPQNVQETIQLMQADTDRLETIAAMDKAEGVHKWVADVRALQRPVAVAAVLAGYAYALAAGSPEALASWGDLARMAVFYLFGDRTLHHLKRGG